MALEKISLNEALALGIGEPFFVVYSPTKPKPQPSEPIEAVTPESKNPSIQNLDSKGLGRGNG